MMAARAKLCGGKTAGPVVEMDDVRRRAQTLEERERRATEKGETLVVVREAVNGIAREILRRVNQKRWRTRRVAIENASAIDAAAPVHIQVINDLFSEMSAINLLEERKHQQRILAILSESFRKRARNIGQPARFGERHSFRRKDRNAQNSSHCARQRGVHK